MQPITHALVEISRFLAQAFIAGLWQGFFLVVIVMLLLRFAPRLRAATRYAIWWCAFALGIMIPLFHLHATVVFPVRSTPLQVHIGTEWGVSIAVLWAAFMLGRAVQFLLQAARLHRVWKHATPVSADSAIHISLQGRTLPAELCVSNDVESPSVIGFFSPRFLIPGWLFEKLTPSELEQILLHEAEHLRRHDDWINLLQKISLVLFPLNPALLWMDRRLSLERELACDAAVIAFSKSRFDYARCLTRLAEHRLLHRSIAFTLSAWSRESELVRRVHSLLKPAGHISGKRARFSSALICAALLIGAAGMAAAPHVISFTDVAAPVAQVPDAVAIPEAAQPIPVAYRTTTPAQPALLKTAITLSHSHSARHKTAPRAQLRSIGMPTRKRAQPRIVLTTITLQTTRYNGSTFPQPAHLVPLLAAVPFQDGWLIVQL
jgi:beta-lactamase regulating signal transducer with metallopeptidase domain